MTKPEPVGWWCPKCRTAGICSSTNPMNTHEDHIPVYTATQIREAWESYIEDMTDYSHAGTEWEEEAERKAKEW